MSTRRAGLRRMAVLLAAVLALVLGAPAAQAHSELTRADPPDGGLVAVGRTSLSLWFSEAVNAPGSTFSVRTLDGVEVVASVAASGIDQGFVQVTVPPLSKDSYVLEWTVLSADDGHSSRGSIVFGAGQRPDVSPAAVGGLPGTPGLLLRWLDLTGIMLAIGAIAISGRVLMSMRAPGTDLRHRALVIGAWAASLASLTGAVTPFVRTWATGLSAGSWFESTQVTLLATPWGHLWIAREIALLCAAAGIWRWAARPAAPRGAARLVAGLSLGAASWWEAASGHASALPERSLTATLASAAHLVGAGVWVGGLTVLAVCVIPVARHRDDTPRQLLLPVWRSFSSMAAVTAGIVVATGLYESGRQVPDLRSVTSTVYGGTVGVKLVLVAVALGLAGINTALLHPRVAGTVARAIGRPVGWISITPRRFPTVVVAAEVTVLALAVGAAAVLTSVPTARDITLAAARTDVHSSNVDGLIITFEELKAGTQEDRLIVRTRSTVRPEPAPVTGVTVVLVATDGTSTTVPLERIEEGRYEAGTAELAPGAWAAVIAVAREGRASVVTEADWTVGSVATAGARPLEIVTSALAVLLLLVTAAALAASRRRGRPSGVTSFMHLSRS